MQRNRSRWTRWLASGILALGLIGSPAAWAQPPNEEEATAESKGRPYDGYIATGVLGFLALFIIGKTARR